MAKIDAFVDWGFEQGSDFARQLFGGPDFREPDLRRLAAGDAKLAKGKAALGALVAERWIDDQVSSDELLDCLVKPYRKWLSLRLGKRKNLPQLADPAELLDRFGVEEWHGPFGPGGKWYVRPFRLPHTGESSGNKAASSGSARWMVYAQIRNQAVLYCWDGLTTKPSDEASRHLQFPFWTYLPEAIAELEDHLQGAGASDYSNPPLHDLVLHQLWDQYIFDEKHLWRHLKVNAEAFGVSLNAKSAPVELNISGLDNLSAEMARASLRAMSLDENSQDQRKPIELELMRTILRSWGANSYEFQLDALDPAGKHHPVMKAHCFFGLRPEKIGLQVAFQHIHCYVTMKGAIAAGDFFLHHLGIDV